ncbi:TonB-linked outer membrane protein, SusC/RagA family [Sphingobacterium psychroaquaticum]|uniref:TonB-linked outer membrane protein, SusC/RagA family n=2 Tax=Sphingobacterium psychroaquaticum TaxID=561061 RepID=A0A1X7I761_9SPHI|nr:TonB-linked outer membrane protein, SusC/RagA family [Sphingobacterium psychroaquaticum]
MKLKKFSSGFFIDRKNPLRQALCISGALLMLSNASMANSYSTHEYALLALNKEKQQKTVRGIVTDAVTQEPLAGVTVKVAGKTIATSTGADGSFELQAASNDVLEISYIGYQIARTTVLQTQGVIRVALQADNSSLEEVVVTGYGTQRKKDLTGAVAVVNTEQLKAQPAATAVEALQGRAAGVQIVNDGAPGSTPQIKIRGYSTINNNEPLYIIDGVPFEGKLSWLNQNDIETMQVLKDASAASIYGARANNGVVIITTKMGKSGKPQINLESYVGIQVPQYNRFPKMMTPQQVYDMNNKMNGTNLALPDYLLVGAKGLEKQDDITPADYDMSKYNYSRDPSTFYQITKANKSGTDWFREVSQTAPTQNYQLSATGGSENASYAMSGGYLNQQGTVIHSEFERFNIRTNTQFKAFDGKLRFGENMQYSYTEGVGMGVNPNAAGGYMGDESVIGWAFRSQTIIPVYDEGGNWAGSRGGYGNSRNPVAVAYRAKDNVNRSSFFFGNAFGEVDILSGLTLRTSFGMRYENYGGRTITYPNPEFSEGSYSNNSLNESSGYNREWTWTNTLNYRKVFDRHSLNVLAGTEAINNRNKNLAGSRNGFFTLSSLDYFYLNAGTSNFGNTGDGDMGSMFSIFGKVDYSFDDRYILSATVRRDGSSNFGPKNKYGVFPGVSGAWRLSAEEFMKPVTWITDLKLRAGYGVTGNQRIPSYNYLNRYASSITHSSYPINGTVESGLWQSDFENVDVKWEQVNAFNIGLDFTLLGGDFDGAIDYYDKKTNDMLFRVPLPAAVAGRATSPYVNVGNMRNHGVEATLGYHYGRRQQKDFTLDVTGMFAKNINKVVALAPSVKQQNYGNFRTIQTTVLKPGEAFGSFYGYQVAGVYKDAADVANSANYSDGKGRPGGLKYVDINGDGVINDADRTVIGNPHPDFVYSLGINAAYKNWDIAMFFYGSQGNDIFDMTRYFTDFGVFNGARSTRLLDAWSPENPNSAMPSLTANPSSFETATSSYYVKDGSFLKMKNLQIGYTFPVQRLFGSNTAINKLRIYAGVTNLFTITKYDGLDPEVTATPSDYPAIGVDLGVYPQSRQYLFGLSLGF